MEAQEKRHPETRAVHCMSRIIEPRTRTFRSARFNVLFQDGISLLQFLDGFAMS
jgi:hypothetical protein